MKHLIVALALIFPQLLWGKSILLVTDMDDTIKVSHVLDKDSAAANAMAVRNAFSGMPELYQALIKVPESTPMHYLSNAPDKMMGMSHRLFLFLNRFPKGILVLNENLLEKNHKVNALREMINRFGPDEMILIGDNGERDPEVYEQIQKEFPQIKATVYIHMAYSIKGFKGSVGKPLLGDQIGWVTSVDLGLDLMNRGYISKKDYLHVTERVEDLAKNENPHVERGQQMLFPAWFDCRDMAVPSMPEVSEEFQKLVVERCAQIPLED